MSSKSLIIQSVIYLSLPLVLFCIGFLRWYVSLLLLASLITSVCWVWIHSSKNEDLRRIPGSLALGVTILSIFVCLACGISGYLSQSYDWITKNPLLNDLTLSSWPLILDFSEATDDVQSFCGERQSIRVIDSSTFNSVPLVCLWFDIGWKLVAPYSISKSQVERQEAIFRLSCFYPMGRVGHCRTRNQGAFV